MAIAANLGAPLDIIGLGLATVDVLLRVSEMPTWEKTTSLSGFCLDGGGPVATACVAAARLGKRAGYVGTAGNDLLGEIKLRTLSERGVELSRVKRREQPETQVVVVYVHAETGERIFAGMREWNMLPLQVEELDREYLTSAKILHLDGTHPEAARQAAEWMREAGKLVSLDGSRTDGRPLSQEMMELVKRVDLLICGSGFGLSLTGFSDPWQAGRTMLQFGPHITVQTDGKAGSFTVTDEEQFHTPAFDVEVVDTTGAGDVFHGAYLVGLLQGWDLKKTALFAAAAAAIKCSQLGGRRGIPTFVEIEDFLRKRGLA